ncbi:hypothetical protein F5B17DRAFT_429791 [Nemania serpens]|nr:hypothetical protein F5B17DRAFT_429791 [Nemania serpens]
MPPKEVLGDVDKTLTSHSLESKNGPSDTCENHDVEHEEHQEHQEHEERGKLDEHEEHHPPEQSTLQPNTIGLDRLSVSQASSTTTISNSDERTLTGSPNTTSSTVGADVEQTPDQTYHTSLQSAERQLLDLATKYFPSVSEDAVFPPLPKPVLVPRLNPGGAIPFARAYALELADHAVVKEDFVTFIDNLNVINTPHLAFRVLEVTGAVVGMVPYDVAEGVGGALEGIAVIGTIALNYKRKKEYLALMNEKYFHPRKLHVKIIGTKRLKRLLGLDKKDPCLAPLTAETLELTSQDRCLRYLSRYTCELSFDVPAPSQATTTLAKITALRIKHKVRKADRLAKAGRKRAWKRHQKGKNPQDRWNSLGERARVKSLEWILVQNLEEWEARKAEKERKKEEKRKASIWRSVV